MGTSTSVAQFAAKLEKAGKDVGAVPNPTVAEVAKAGKVLMLANMGFTRMRGVGKKGARVGVRYEVTGGDANPGAVLKYNGPVHLANNDTLAHRIDPRGKTRTASGRKRRGPKAVVIGGQPYAYANHPGTRGKRFFQRSVPQVEKVSGKILRKNVQAALRKTF